MFGRIYENMDKEEFLLRFKDELREPVDHALNCIQEELDQDKPPSPNDVIKTISKFIGQYYRHELDDQFIKPNVNPFEKMSPKHKGDIMNALLIEPLIEWIIQEMVYEKSSKQKIKELEEELEEVGI